MFSMMLEICNNLGTMAFALSGARQFEVESRSGTLRTLVPAFVTCFSTSFCGGLARDVLILHSSTPAILSSQNAVLVMLLTYFAYSLLVFLDRRSLYRTRGAETFLTVADATGSAIFLFFGKSLPNSSYFIFSRSYPI